MRQTAKFDYYYGTQADTYSFYRIPKVLFTSQFFKGLSCEAKVLYGLMLDRMSLSIKNKWFDEEGRVYIMFSIDDVMEYLGCYKQKAVKLVHELDQEHGIGLIEKKRIGFGKANTFYVKNFILQEEPDSVSELPHQALGNADDGASVNENKPSSGSFSGKKGEFGSDCGSDSPENDANPQCFENQNTRSSKIETLEVRKSKFKKFENQTTDGMKIEIQEVRKSNPNYNNYNYTENNENESNLSIHERMEQIRDREEMEDRSAYEDYIIENISFSVLCEKYGLERATEVLDLLLDTVCTKKSKIIIGGEPKSVELVRNRFLKLEYGHIQYVLDCMDKNSTKIRNIRQYMLAALYNAPTTKSQYYTAEVNHDMYGVDA